MANFDIGEHFPDDSVYRDLCLLKIIIKLNGEIADEQNKDLWAGVEFNGSIQRTTILWDCIQFYRC